MFAGLLAPKRVPHTREGHVPGSDRDRMEARLTTRFRRITKFLGMTGVSVHTLRHSCASRTVTGVLPGRFLFMTMSGHFARVEIRGPVATVELGKATLTVHAPPGTSICLAPGEPDPLADLFAMRVGHRAVPASGALTFPGLADGAYRLLTEVPAGSGRKAAETPVSTQEGREAVVDLPSGK